MDKGSSNGTYISDERIKPNVPRQYKSNEYIRLGQSKDKIRLQLVEDKTATPSTPSSNLISKSSKKSNVTPIKPDIDIGSQIIDMKLNARQEVIKIERGAREKIKGMLEEQQRLQDSTGVLKLEVEDIKTKNIQALKKNEKLVSTTTKMQEKRGLLEKKLAEIKKECAEEARKFNSIVDKIKKEAELIQNKSRMIKSKAMTELEKISRNKKLLAGECAEIKLKKDQLEEDVGSLRHGQVEVEESLEKSILLLNQAKSEIKRLDKWKKHAEGELDELREKHCQVEHQLTELDHLKKKKVQELRQEEINGREKIKEIESKLREVDENRELAYREMKGATEKKLGIEKEIDELGNCIQRIKNDLEYEKDQFEKKTSELKEQETCLLNEYQEKKKVFVEKESLLNDELDALKKSRNKSRDELEEINQKFRQMLEDRKEIQQEIQGIKIEKINLEKELEELSIRENQEQKKLNEMEDQVLDLKNKHQDYLDRLEKGNNDLKNILAEIEKSENDLSKLNQSRQMASDDLEKIKQEGEEEVERITGKIDDLKKVATQIRKENDLLHSENKKLENRLNEINNSYDAVSQKMEKLDYDLSEAKEVREKARKLDLAEKEYLDRNVDLEKRINFFNDEKGIRKQQLDQIKIKIEAAENRESEVYENTIILKKEIKNSQKGFDEIEQKSIGLKKEIINLEKNICTINNTRENCLDELQKSEKYKTDLNNDIQELKNQNNLLVKENDNFKGIKEANRKEFDQLKSNIKTEMELLDSRIKDRQEKKILIGKVVSDLNRERANQQQQLSQFEQKSDNIKAEIIELNSNVAKIKEIESNCRNELSEKENYKDELIIFINQFENQKQSLKCEIDNFKDIKAANQLKLDELREKEMIEIDSIVKQAKEKEREKIYLVSQVEKLESEKVAKKQNLEELNENKIETLNETKGLENRVEELEGINVELKSKGQRFEQQITLLEDEVEDLEKQSRLETENVKQMCQQREEKQMALDVLEEEKKRAMDYVQQLGGEVRTVEDERQKLQERVDQLDYSIKEAEEVRNRSNQLDGDVESYLRKKERLDLEIKSFDDERRKKTEELLDSKVRTEHKINKIIEEAESNAGDILSNAHLKADETRRESEIQEATTSREIEDIIFGARNDADQIKQQIEEEQKKKSEEWDEEYISLQGKWKHEYEEKKKCDDRSLAAERMRRLEQLKEKSIQEDKRIIHKRKDEIEGISRTLEDLFITRTKDILKERDKTKLLREFSTEIKGIVRGILTGEGVPQDKQIHKIMKYNPNLGDKMRRFWIKVAVIFTVPAILISVHFIFPSFYSGIGPLVMDFIKTDNSASDIFLKKVMDEREKRLRYGPSMTDDYKESYTQNVLYTKNYIKNKLDQKYQDRWVIALNDFLVNKLELGDQLIVKLISVETALIRGLAEIRSKINPAFEQEAIERMDELEEEALSKMTDMFPDEQTYDHFQVFKRSFYYEFVSLQ